MKRILAATLCLAIGPALAQDNPFAAFKGKIRDGNWEYRSQMDGVPGMPPGMKMPEQVYQHCVTAQDVERGGVGQKDGKLPDGCSVKNMKMAGNTASYTMECVKDPKMTVNSTMTFGTDQFTVKQAMVMDQGGQKMNMNNSMTGRYLGPCAPGAAKGPPTPVKK